MLSAGCLNSSASSPNPGTIAVHAQPDGSNERSVTFRASPGDAPSTYTGPAIGLMMLKSSVRMASAVDVGLSCPPAPSTSASSPPQSTRLNYPHHSSSYAG